jgi:phospholipid/cholesterol/gamma-HCH transport system permease protein
MTIIFERLGSFTIGVLNSTGLMSIMLVKALGHAFTRPFKFRNLFKQLEFVGVQSLFVVILTGAFTGMVLALQSFYALKKVGSESMVGTTVALSMARELGPVLTGLMVSGRAGSAMATELATMRVTEQIDALFTMGVNPIKYLVTPRIIAGLLMLPLLAIVADFVGVLGGYLVGVKFLGINPGVYIARTIDYVAVGDILDGLIKAFFFGVIITLSACYNGYYATGGAEGVGRAATRAVVMGCVLILVSDYIITSLML